MQEHTTRERRERSGEMVQGKVWNDRRQQGQIECMEDAGTGNVQRGAGGVTEICHQMFKHHGTLSVSVWPAVLKYLSNHLVSERLPQVLRSQK